MEKSGIPLGYRFNPTPQEILQYLESKKDGTLHGECAIKEIDLTTVQDPARLFEWVEKDCNVVYTFTKWDKDSGQLQGVKSVAGNGSWLRSRGRTAVYSTDEHGGSSRCMGWFRPRTFQPNAKGNQDYSMKEFSLNKEFKDYVVCEIKKKDRSIKPTKNTAVDDPQESNSNLLPETEEYEKSILDDYPISAVYFVHGSSSIDYAGKVTPVNAPPLDKIELLPVHSKEMEKPSIPLGYRFDPTREELIEYLSCKAMGKALPYDGAIKEIDLSRAEDVEKLFEGKGEECKILYAFGKLNNTSDRKVGETCSWVPQDGAGTAILGTKDTNIGKHIGFSRSFTLNTEEKGNYFYTMNQFTLENDTLSRATFKDYVVCEIKRRRQTY